MITRDGSKCKFELVHSSAKSIYIVGDFNGWSTTATAMEHLDSGLWRATIELPPGTYHFRYFVDGQWLNDYAAFGLKTNPSGGFDSVVWIPDQQPKATEPAIDEPEITVQDQLFDRMGNQLSSP